MVEMTEARTSSNNLTERSLIVLDEVGREQALRGLSLAGPGRIPAGERGADAFCHHFHELTALAEGHSAV